MNLNELQKLLDAAALCSMTLTELRDYAEAKQKQRAEPWQQSIIDKCTITLALYYEKIAAVDMLKMMKESDV